MSPNLQCFTCGGNHYQSQCPQNQKGAWGKGGKGIGAVDNGAENAAWNMVRQAHGDGSYQQNEWVSSVGIAPKEARGKDMRPKKPMKKVTLSEEVMTEEVKTPEWASEY